CDRSGPALSDIRDHEHTRRGTPARRRPSGQVAGGSAGSASDQSSGRARASIASTAAAAQTPASVSSDGTSGNFDCEAPLTQTQNPLRVCISVAPATLDRWPFAALPAMSLTPLAPLLSVFVDTTT